MGNYLVPTSAPVSSDYDDHRNRNPPSSEPGTDYACAYGTALAVAGTGTVIDRKSDNGGATGRYITVKLDDGNTVRYLHLSQLFRSVGDRVARGDTIAASGASANGNDWGVGAHVHTTLWIGPAWATPTVDFEKYTEGNDMPLNADTDYVAFATMLQRALQYDARTNGYGTSQSFGSTLWERLNVLETNVVTKIDDDTAGGSTDPCETARATRRLGAPAWLGGASLLALAVLELVRLTITIAGAIPG